MWGTGGRMDGWEPNLSPKMELGSSRGGTSTGQGLTIKLDKSRITPSSGRMVLSKFLFVGVAHLLLGPDNLGLVRLLSSWLNTGPEDLRFWLLRLRR